jgi:hypothetical protein
MRPSEFIDFLDNVLSEIRLREDAGSNDSSKAFFETMGK